MNPALQGLITIIVGVGGCVGYFYFANILLDRGFFPQRGVDHSSVLRRKFLVSALVGLVPLTLVLAYLLVIFAIGVIVHTLGVLLAAFGVGFGASFIAEARLVFGFAADFISRDLVVSIGRITLAIAAVTFLISPWRARTASQNINRANAIRPWLFLFPALFALGLYLAYPVFSTLWLSLTDRDAGGAFVGAANYAQMLDEDKFWEAVRNNFLWLLIVPAASTAFGLLAAQLTDRISWGNIAKSLIFMPMAISFVGAAVIFKLIYDARPEDVAQIGILNAIYMNLGGESPITWLTVPFWNNLLLMIVLIWIQTGFAMVILSAALRGIPEETVEAAIVDGANPFQIFFKIKVPQIMGTIVVVWTTITIVVLKVFDIVFAMTNGQWETQVLANYMYDKLFRANDWGVGSASAMVIMLMVTPILVWNVYNARKEMR